MPPGDDGLLVPIGDVSLHRVPVQLVPLLTEFQAPGRFGNIQRVIRHFDL